MQYNGFNCSSGCQIRNAVNHFINYSACELDEILHSSAQLLFELYLNYSTLSEFLWNSLLECSSHELSFFFINNPDF